MPDPLFLFATFNIGAAVGLVLGCLIVFPRAGASRALLGEARDFARDIALGNTLIEREDALALAVRIEREIGR